MTTEPSFIASSIRVSESAIILGRLLDQYTIYFVPQTYGQTREIHSFRRRRRFRQRYADCAPEGALFFARRHHFHPRTRRDEHRRADPGPPYVTQHEQYGCPGGNAPLLGGPRAAHRRSDGSRAESRERRHLQPLRTLHF